MKKTLWVFVIALCALGVFFVFAQERKVGMSFEGIQQNTQPEEAPLPDQPNEEEISQRPTKLENPPEIIRALYLTSWSGGSTKKLNYVIDLAKRSPINAVVIDIKDYSGYVSYDTDVSDLERYGAEEKRILDIDNTIRTLHDAGIYVIARVTVFQDPLLAEARPDLAVQDSRSSLEDPTPWKDRKGISWVDSSSREVWDYNIAVARDAIAHGFDEINFDYIRFPSDGNLETMRFSSWDKTRPMHEVIREFFAYLHERVNEVPISADLFGLTTTAMDDLGIGQVIEDAYEYFDFVSPMVYPSHYAPGSYGYAKPALYPYEIVYGSLLGAMKRLYPPSVLIASSTTSTTQEIAPEKKFIAKLRPWLQDFDLGADYTADMIQAQIRATRDATKDDYVGYMLWAPSNVYTQGGIIE